MTDNIETTVQEKTAWAKVPQEFNDWWNGDYSDESNPFRLNSAAYWAWAGWSEAVRLNAQAVPCCTNYAAGTTCFSDPKENCPMLSAAPAAPQPAAHQGDALSYVHPVPDHCDRIVWRNRYLHLVGQANGAAPQPAQPLTDEQRKFLLFLDGSGDWDGVWFGDPHPTRTGAYWWRKDMHDVFHGIGVKP